MSLKESIKDRVREQAQHKEHPKTAQSFDALDLPTLEKQKNAAIALIDKQANAAKSAIEFEYRQAVAKIALDLKKAQTEIAKADKLSKKKTPVTRSEAKAKVRSEKISAQALMKRLRDFDSNCAYCGEYLGKNKQIDHVVPISKMGADVLENIVYACQSCNCSKGDKDPLKWYRAQSFWTPIRENRLLSITGKLDALKK